MDASDLDAVAAAIRPETVLVFTETPANPTLKLTDLAAVSEITSEHGVLHVTDNTFLTPYFQRPFELGCDVVLHSTTKYLDGHNATLGGAVVVNEHGSLGPNPTVNMIGPWKSSAVFGARVAAWKPPRNRSESVAA